MKKKKSQVKNFISIVLLIIFIIIGRYVGTNEVQSSINLSNNEVVASLSENVDYNEEDGHTAKETLNKVVENTEETSLSEKNIQNDARIAKEDVNFNNDKLNIMFFYVGQADSSFIKLNDKTILIDAGNNGDGTNIANFLKEKSVTKIDYLIGTHCDEDHIGGLDEIVDDMEVGKILMPSKGRETANYKNVIKSAKRKNLQVENPNVGDDFKIDNMDMKILSVENNDDYSDNNSSIVSEITYINNKFLFMGDAEKEIENMYSWERVDVLKVGHHGSNTSSTERFLNQVKPTYSVIEVGKNNSYRLPNKYTIKRLENIGTKILRTDTNETSFLMTSDGNNINTVEANVNLDSGK